MRAMPLQSLSAATLAEDRPDRLTAMLPWLVGLLIILPLAFTDIPPLGDYPNHLARVTIMAALPNDPILSQFFEASYRPIPNLAFDLIVGPLSTILGVHAAGRVFVALTLLAGLGGVLCYHRALFQRVSIWPLVAGLFAFNQYLLSGFINFALGIGLAFGCAGISYSIRDRGARPRLLAQLIFVVVLYFTHLAGFIFYAVLLGMQELGWALAWRDRAFKVLLLRWAGVALAMAPAMILFFLSGDAQGGAEAPAAIKGSMPAVAAPLALMTELRTFGAMALAGYYPWINAIFGLYLAVGVLVLMARRRLRFAWIPICTACLLGVVCILFIKMQFLFPNSLLQRRLPAIIVLLLILSIDVPSFGPARLWAIGAGILLLAVQTASLGLSFSRYDAESPSEKS